MRVPDSFPSGIYRKVFTLVFSLLCLSLSPVSAQVTAADIQSLQEQGEREGWTFTVGINGASEYSLDDLCGLVPPEGWEKSSNFDPCTPTRDLPSAFDWRDSTTLPPVRNQGGCGSCWAFATVGPLECNISIKDGITVNLSEQWLVSCNHNDWGCDGGWWAHSYHQSGRDNCNHTGAVPESECPYAAADLPCGCPYEHTYRISSWYYVGNQSSIPSVGAIKQAILDHGPISVAVVSTSAMHAYNGGVFNFTTGGDVNHGVVLVGWDDNQGTEGVWYMRNSWGSWWGEGGYMRIEYGCSKIGYGAAYINYPGALTITTESLPACSLGVYYEQQLETSGGAGAITWSDRDDMLTGTGLALSETGLLTGMPVVEENISFMALVEDPYDREDEHFYSIPVDKYLAGDANADAQVNLGDAVYVINHIFSGGPAPWPVPMAGDANCDVQLNLGDPVYLINYVFKGGPGPVCD
jgi:C1A family cysteine protease